MATIRLFPGKANVSPIKIINTTYTPVQGTAIDAEGFLAAELEANGYVRSNEVGTTALRPAHPTVGQQYIDTTITAVILWDGTVWRNSITGASV